MVGASASVNLPLHHKVQKFSTGTGSPGWSWKKGRKRDVVVSLGLLYIFVLIMVALCNRADHYIFALWFLSFFLLFFPRLISAVGDWISAILPHMVWP